MMDHDDPNLDDLDEPATPWLAILGIFMLWIVVLIVMLEWVGCTASTPC